MMTPQTQPETLPAHVAIIPDGNRRWAKLRGIPTLMGHKAGAELSTLLVEEAQRLGIKALSIWGFSTENWKRTEEEVGYLMQLIEQHVAKSWQRLAKQNIRFHFSGDLQALPESLQKLLQDTYDKAKDNTGLVLNLCISYGGRDELVRAARKMVADGVGVQELTEDKLASYLDTAGLPDIDLVIRTSGEQRLSGLFPWQTVYAELYFTPLFFPDFTVEEFHTALEWFAERKRRFGK